MIQRKKINFKWLLKEQSKNKLIRKYSLLIILNLKAAMFKIESVLYKSN